MATISISKVLQGADQAIKEQDALLEQYGYKRIGNEYRKVPTESEQLKDVLGTQQAALNLKKTQQDLDPTYQIEKIKREAQAKAEAELQFPKPDEAANRQIASISTVLNQIKSLSSKVNTGRNKAAQLPEWVGAISEENPDAALLLSKRAYLSNIIRFLGEKGNLAEGDVQRAIDAIPHPMTTKDVAQRKIADLEEVLSSVMNANPSTAGRVQLGAQSQPIAQPAPSKKVQTLRQKYSY